MNQLQSITPRTGLMRTLRLWAGKRLAPFTGRNLFSVSKHNELMQVGNCFLNPQIIITGNRTAITITDEGWTIEISAADVAAAGGIPSNPPPPSGDSGIQEAIFQSFGFGGNNDYVTAIVAGQIVGVRLPPNLRFSVAARNPYNAHLQYGPYNPIQQSRVLTAFGVQVTQYITQQYLPGDLLYVASINGIWQDMNVSARVFAGPNA